MKSHQPVQRNRATTYSLQRRAPNGKDCVGCFAPPIVHDALSSPGQPLAPATRTFMEPRFGHDFTKIRVHTDETASKSANAVNALAYTVGRNIVFGQGQFRPETTAGRMLLAHELTHSIQQHSFASTISPHQPITIEPPGTSLEQAAERHSSRLSAETGAIAPVPQLGLQRQPKTAETADIPSFTIFVAPESRRKDKQYASKLAQADAARIRKSGTLSTEERQLVNSKLRFFDGAAHDAYQAIIRPALIEVTQEEIEMPGETAEPSTAPAKNYPDWDAAVGKFVKASTYIDNEIQKISYFFGELAQIHYRDGTMLELGLIPKWMKLPFEEVDYHTPKEEIRPFIDMATGKIGFFLEEELATVPGSMSYGEMQKRFLHPLVFSVAVPSGRLVPNRVNMLTAPTLCNVLQDQERQYVEKTNEILEVAEKFTAIIGMYAGAGGLMKGPGTAVRTVGPRVAATAGLSAAGRKLAFEMDELLASGATKTLAVERMEFAGVQLVKQGSRLAVKRFMSKLPAAAQGVGIGTRLSMDFEEAAVTVARMRGFKSVTIDVGIIVNPAWRVFLEARGYVHNLTAGSWIKTIIL